MSTRRKVVVPDTTTVIGETNRFLKLPHAHPRQDSDHAANARELERWGNRIPMGGGDCDCGCWYYEPGRVFAWESGVSPGWRVHQLWNTPPPTSTDPPPFAVGQYEREGLLVNVSLQVDVPVSTTTQGQRIDLECTLDNFGVYGGLNTDIMVPYIPGGSGFGLGEARHQFNFDISFPGYSLHASDLLVRIRYRDVNGDYLFPFPNPIGYSFMARSKVTCMNYYIVGSSE